MIPAFDAETLAGLLLRSALNHIQAEADRGAFRLTEATPPPPVPQVTAHMRTDRAAAFALLDWKNRTMTAFTVDCAFSNHDALKDGIICLGVSRVQVLAENGDSTELLAAQIVACRGFMPTATIVCI